MVKILLFAFTLSGPVAYSQCTFTVNANPSDEDCPNACNGRIKIVSVSGGVSPYSYSWSTGDTAATIKNLCPATYTLVVTDKNGCKDTVTYTINPSTFNVNITKNNLTCFGMCDGSITATPTGGNPAYTYYWSPGGQTTAGISNLCAGTFTLTLTDSKNNCTITRVVALTEPTELTTTVTSTPATCSTCPDGSATVAANGGNKPYDYLWTPGNNTTTKITGVAPGTYTVCVTDKNGCKVCKTVTITYGVSGINTLAEPGEISIYPNPASDHLCIRASQLNGLSVKVFDIAGVEVKELKFSKKGDVLMVDVKNLSPGIYILCYSGKEGAGIRKIMIAE